MWDNSICNLVDADLHGGTSHAIVTDSKAKIQLVVSVCFVSQHCYIGKAHMMLPCSMPSEQFETGWLYLTLNGHAEALQSLHIDIGSVNA